MTSSASSKLLHELKNSPNLPSLPHVLLKLISACNNSETSPQKLSQIIFTDPSISAQALRLVNSAYTGLRRKIDDLETAVIYLGVDSIKNIAITASVFQAFRRVKGDDHFNLRYFWWHSLMTATLAKRIAVKIDYNSPEEAHLSGLLHDIGRLTLWVYSQNDYAAVMRDAGDSTHRLIAGEKKIGASHFEIGAWLVKQWRFDSFMADAILYHHDRLERIGDALPLVKIVYAANALCHQLEGTSETGDAVLQAIFEFNAEQVEEVLKGAEKEVSEIAQSLDIAVEPSPTRDQPESKQDRAKQEALLAEVKNFSLLYGTLQNLLKAEKKSDIFKTVQQGLGILFDVRPIFFFLYDSENDTLGLA